VHTHPDFQLVISYNPGYQSLLKDLKPSTKQRFATFEFDYPSAELEAQIVCAETGLDTARAKQLVRIALAARQLKGHGLTKGTSTCCPRPSNWTPGANSWIAAFRLCERCLPTACWRPPACSVRSAWTPT
jgi:hypothetical protein